MDFDRDKKRLFRKIDKEEEVLHDELEGMLDKLTELDKNLMDIELQFIEMENTAVDDFINQHLRGATGEMADKVQETFNKYRDDANALNKLVETTALAEVEAYNSGAEGEWEEELEAFLDNKEGVVMAISTFFENLLGKLSKTEEKIVGPIKDEANNFLHRLKNEQYERNRRNVTHVHELIDKLHREIEERRRDNDSEFSNA